MAVLDAAGIAAILPHRGAMSLLDAVIAVDAARIECLSDSHRRKPHPMADADGRLGIACAIEYGAQAMALHAALSLRAAADGSPPARLPVGMLAGVRALRCTVPRFDDVDAPLRIVATLASGDARTAIYQLTIDAAGKALLEGRATVVIDAASVSTAPSAVARASFGATATSTSTSTSTSNANANPP